MKPNPHALYSSLQEPSGQFAELPPARSILGGARRGGRRLARRIVTSLACLLLLTIAAQNSRASLILKISDGSTTKTIVDEDTPPGTNADAADGIPGDVAFIGKVGVFTVNLSGESKPLQGSEEYPDLTLSGSVTGGAGTLTVSLTDTGFTLVPPGFYSTVSATVNDQVSIASYADFTDAEFGTGTPLGSFGPYVESPVGPPGKSFSGDDTKIVSGNSPFSLSIVAQVTNSSSRQTDQITSEVTSDGPAVPEPGAIALMALGGLLLVTVKGRRFLSASRLKFPTRGASLAESMK